MTVEGERKADRDETSPYAAMSATQNAAAKKMQGTAQHVKLGATG